MKEIDKTAISIIINDIISLPGYADIINIKATKHKPCRTTTIQTKSSWPYSTHAYP